MGVQGGEAELLRSAGQSPNQGGVSVGVQGVLGWGHGDVGSGVDRGVWGGTLCEREEGGGPRPPLPEGGGGGLGPPLPPGTSAQSAEKKVPSAHSAGTFFSGFSDICEREEGGVVWTPP